MLHYTRKLASVSVLCNGHYFQTASRLSLCQNLCTNSKHSRTRLSYRIDVSHKCLCTSRFLYMGYFSVLIGKIKSRLVFTARCFRMLCIRGTSHGPVSVSVCVRLSQVGVLLKQLNVGSHKQNHTIAHGL